jgi:hypothetical protein
MKGEIREKRKGLFIAYITYHIKDEIREKRKGLFCVTLNLNVRL